MASVVIRGSICLANGKATGLVCSSKGVLLEGNSSVEYASSLMDGACAVEMQCALEAPLTDDESVRRARHILLTDLLPNVLLQGTGVRLTLEWIERPGAAPKRVIVDGVLHETTPTDAINLSFLHQAISILPPVRWALKDFNHGLLEREDCPFMFYRAIETIGRVVIGQQEQSDLNWTEVHRRLGTSRSDLTILERLRNDHGHGSHTYFSRAEHDDMKNACNRVLERAIGYLDGNRPVIEQWLRSSGAASEDTDRLMGTLPRG